MIDDIENIAQLGGTVVTVSLFIWYLIKKEKSINDTYEKFNTTISNHLDHSTKVIERNNEVYNKMSVALTKLCMTIKKSEPKNKHGLDK